MLNPWARIRELERLLEVAELARVRAEDEARRLHADNDSVRAAEKEARQEELRRMERVSDWMALQSGKRAVFSSEVPPAAAPLPLSRGTRHGADIEKQMLMEAERGLGIDPVQ